MNRPPVFAVWVFALAPLAGYSEEGPRPPGPPPSLAPNGLSPLRPALPSFTSAQSVIDAPASIPGPELAVLMDRVIVQGPKLPTFGELQLLTKEQRASLLNKRYPGAVVPMGDPLTETVPNYAATMLRDDQRLGKIKGLTDTAELYRLSGDFEGEKKIKLESQRSLIRHSDWRTEGMDRSYNNGRR